MSILQTNFKRKMTNSLKWVSSFIKGVDQANFKILQYLPSSFKRKLVGTFFTVFAYHLAKQPIKLGSLQLYVPPRLVRYYAFSELESNVSKMIKRFIRPGMTIVDVGANIGIYTILMAKAVGASGRVYAVEPSTENLELLYKNIELNGLNNVQVIPFAAGMNPQLRKFYLNEASTRNSFYRSSATISTIEVKEIPLDSVIKEPVDFVKIDVEGGEIDALKGMTQLLESNPAIKLLVEWNPTMLQQAGHHVGELPGLLRSLGFAVSIVTEDGTLSSHSVETFLDLWQAHQLDDTWYANLYVQPNSHSTYQMER
jgi:FkbM family methyltransferase